MGKDVGRDPERMMTLRESPFIHSCHFFSASASPLPLRSAPDTARIVRYCAGVFTPKRHRQLRVKDLEGDQLAPRLSIPFSHELHLLYEKNCPSRDEANYLCVETRHWTLADQWHAQTYSPPKTLGIQQTFQT